MTARVPGDDGVGDLVRRARDGDGRAFEDLVRRYRPRIFALALHVTGSEPDADDVAQEVFLRAYRSLQAFEGRGGFFNWIYRIALHLAFDRRREHARRAGPSPDDPRLERAVAVDAGGNPQRAAAIRQIYRRLLAAMDALSPTLRATIILVCLQGMSHPEAAAVLGTTPGTIAWRIHEARAQLRAAVTAAPGPRPPPPPAARARATPASIVDRDASSGPFNLASLSTWYH